MPYTLELHPDAEEALKRQAEQANVDMETLLTRIVEEASGERIPKAELDASIAAFERGEGRDAKEAIREIARKHGLKVPDE